MRLADVKDNYVYTPLPPTPLCPSRVRARKTTGAPLAGIEFLHRKRLAFRALELCEFGSSVRAEVDVFNPDTTELVD